MKGVVFQTSVATMTRYADQVCVNQFRSVCSMPFTKPVVGSKANRHTNAATTVMMP